MKLTLISLILAIILIGCDCAKNAISSCIYTHKKNVVTFICSEFENERLFHASTTHRCDKGDIDVVFHKADIKTVNFFNCELQHLARELYEEYDRIQVLDVSYLGLKWLYLEEARRLIKLFAKHNKLKMIPERLGGIKEIDLSYNEIDGSSSDAFRFSHENLLPNRKQNVDRKAILDGNKVKTLNLSYNRFNELSAGIFGKFKELLHLNLSHNQISSIKPKALMHQKKLQTLDLSCNMLMVISNNIFAFKSKHLKSLLIEENNDLRTMTGFTTSNFPSLKISNTKNIKIN